MRVAIVYNEPGPSAAELDVLVQRDAVHATLAALGHECQPIACTLNLSLVIEQIRDFSPDVVFNLVESLDATDRLAVLVPMLLDANHIAYTGTRARAMLDTSDKVLVKQRLKALGLPTPAWYAQDTGSVLGPCTFIIKSRYEHASVGLDDSAVVTVNSGDELAEIIRTRAAQFNVEMFAEQFIAGREFNLSVMATNEGGCQTLAPAEIDFSGFPDGKPQIVNFDAKWTETTFEYSATPRCFYFPKEDDALLLELARLTRVVWQEFDLKGYARVDYRVDEAGQPFILEINTNPCLSPDAGFVAAVQQSGSDFAAAIATIVEAGATFKA
jgi:D-alanine-D-alanine ligase